MPSELDQDSINELNSFISQLVLLFTTLKSTLVEIYGKDAKIKEPEAMIDPVEEFLAKDSLMTSAQKERKDKGIDEDDDVVVQKDIIIYQSLSNLLMLISNLQNKSYSANRNNLMFDQLFKIFTNLSEAMNELKSYQKRESYSPESLQTSIRQLLHLQNSAFRRLSIKSLENIGSSLSVEHNSFINKSTFTLTHNYSIENIPL
jgi:hypothetical protein